MQQYVGQFEISVHNFMFNKNLEGIKYLAKIFNNFLLRQRTFLTYLSQHISSITILQHQVIIMRRLLQGVQFYYMRIITCFQHFDFVLQQLVELACVLFQIPFIISRRIDLIATISRVSWCLPRKTSPYCPLPILSSRTYLSMTFGMQLLYLCKAISCYPKLIHSKQACIVFILHVMTPLTQTAIITAIFFLTLTTVFSYEADHDDQITELQEQLQSLHPHFVDHFIQFYHTDSQTIKPQSFVKVSRLHLKKGTYFLILGKMYLYGLLPDKTDQRLTVYTTESNYLASYFYLRVAAEKFQNPEAYYLLGILEQYKLVPDQLLSAHLANIVTKTKSQQILLRYLQQSHLYNAESNLYMSSAYGFDPASLVLGYMNRNRLGTNKNCSASLAYYLSVIQNTYVESFVYRQIYNLDDSLQEQLYSHKKLPKLQEHHTFFIQETDYYDQQTISATIELADNYYMGRNGYVRNVTRAAILYEKLAQQGNEHGKVMAGLCYFKGEGVPQDRNKARDYFRQTPRDEVSAFMLLAIKYFQILEKDSKPAALNIMMSKYKASKNEKLSPQMSYLIGAAIIKGELKGITTDEGYALLDKAAAQGNTLAKVLLGILFADGSSGLKFGCEQATKYFAEEATVFPFFKNQISMAQVALKRGLFTFAMIKYMELSMIGYENSFVNLLYLLSVYKDEALNMYQNSWSLSLLERNQAYKSLKLLGLYDVRTYILKLYTVQNQPALNYNNMDSYFICPDNITLAYLKYIHKKVIKWGSLTERKNIIKYYEYKLALEEGSDVLHILINLASGDSQKLYVSQARYLLGKYYHQKALSNKSSPSKVQYTKIISEYNRAFKSELVGSLIYSFEQYRLGGELSLDFFQSEVGQDLMAYIFVVSIFLFVLYYLRSKRIDNFHQTELQKQKRMQQEQEMERRQREKNEMSQPTEQTQSNGRTSIYTEDALNQPTITEDEVKGVRIGSSLQEQ